MKLLTDKIQVTKSWKAIFCQSVTPSKQGDISGMISNGTLSRDKTIYLISKKNKVYCSCSSVVLEFKETWLTVVIEHLRGTESVLCNFENLLIAKRKLFQTTNGKFLKWWNINRTHITFNSKALICAWITKDVLFSWKKLMKTNTKMEFNTIVVKKSAGHDEYIYWTNTTNSLKMMHSTRKTIVLMSCYSVKHSLLELDMCDKCKCKSNKLVWNISRRQTLLLHDNCPFTYWYNMIRTMYYENHKAGDNNKFLCKSNYGNANTWQSSLFGIMEVLED